MKMQKLILILIVCCFNNRNLLHAEHPNILWINAEDMSPHLGCYGHPDAHTPNIDSLARDGIVYRNAFATAPICSPSRSCLATGLYATSLGTQHLRCEVKLPDRVVPLANRMRELGYFCTNTGKSDYNFNPDGIWDEWSGDIAPWRKRNAGQPFFGFVTIGETHEGPTNLRDRYDDAVKNLPRHLRHDPAEVSIPPFYPDTPEIRTIFAGLYDLATVFDRKVGDIVEALKQDGELENTIIFVFGDHGNGLPRYKRWLNDSGLRVPLVVYLPPQFRHLTSDVNFVAAGNELEESQQGKYRTTDRLVSFVDFPATALRLAGGNVPSVLQGIPFLGEKTEEQRKFVFGARSRADDMFEVSRSISDGRFIYIRHFLPHLPYIQDSVIFDDRKSSFRELRKLYQAGELDAHAKRLWARQKPVEEFYDLRSDPHELVNLAKSNEHQETKNELADRLRRWILESRDSGFLTEAEYQIRSARNGSTPFDVLRDPSLNLNAILEMAWCVGDEETSVERIQTGLEHQESAVRYWASIACTVRLKSSTESKQEFFRKVSPSLVNALNDSSPSVQIAAAEAILSAKTMRTAQPLALETLGEVLQDTRPWVALEAASTLARLGEQVQPLVKVMKDVCNKNRSAPGSRRPYKDFNYASFTGWALETALKRCGESDFVEDINTNDR